MRLRLKKNAPCAWPGHPFMLASPVPAGLPWRAAQRTITGADLQHCPADLLGRTLCALPMQLTQDKPQPTTQPHPAWPACHAHSSAVEAPRHRMQQATRTAHNPSAQPGLLCVTAGWWCGRNHMLPLMLALPLRASPDPKVSSPHCHMISAWHMPACALNHGGLMSCKIV
jgi:hypothetical protein